MKPSRKVFLSLSLAFSASAVLAQDARTPILQGNETSYWKPESVDVVIALRRCPETTACGEIYWYNSKDARVARNFRDRSLPRETVQDFCGFSPRMSFREVNANRWEGWMNVRGRGLTVDMTVTAVDANTIELLAYKKPIPKFVKSKKDVWHRVEPDDPRYPACRR